jgi:hypothetical protein
MGKPLWFLSRRRMVLNRGACIIMLWMKLPSRTSIRCLGLMIYLVNYVVHVCSPKSIFDRDRITWRCKNVTFRRLPSFWGMVSTRKWWCLLDWLMLRPTIWIWWTRYLLAVIKCIYLPPTYLHFIQDIEDRCFLLTSFTSFVDLPFQDHQMMEKHHMDQNPCISLVCPK